MDQSVTEMSGVWLPEDESYMKTDKMTSSIISIIKAIKSATQTGSGKGHKYVGDMET